MSKTIEEIDMTNSELIPENILYEIFETQYDDLFCKILKISEKSFTYFLQQQVIFNLLIIQKKVDPSILTAFQELFYKRYKENAKSTKKNFEIIKNKESNNSEDLIYLDVTKCYIHCHKCYTILHKCGSKLILYDEHVYCTKCNNVYNKNQIMLLCPECKKNYFTKLRKPIINNNKKYDKLFILKYKKYHCPSDKEEKIKCIKCSNNLYFRLIQNNPKNEESINTIYCIKCKLKYNLKDVLFKCKICLNNFKCQAKIYRDFPSKKRKLLFLIHTLLRNKNALPNINLCIKKCNCDLKDIVQYNHKEDEGIFLEGIKNNKKSVVCSACFNIFKYNEVKWHCPLCGGIFKYKNTNKSRSKSKNKTNRNNSFRELRENNNNTNEIKKVPVLNINTNNIFKKKNDYYIGFMKSEDGNKYKINRLDKINSINFDFINNKEKLNKILVNSKKNAKKISRSFLIVKSKSKNDLIRKKNNNSKVNTLKNKNCNITNLQGIINNNININVINENNNDDELDIKSELNTKGKNEIKKTIKKKIDTNSIFNNIKNNILNLDEPYPELYLEKENRLARASEKNINNIVKNEGILNSIKPKAKNSHYINNLYNNNFDFDSKDNTDKNEFIESNDYINSDIISHSSKKVSLLENYENIPKEKKKKINYAKKIFFFNGKLDKDSKLHDEKIRNNSNKYTIKRDMFKKYNKYTNDKNNYDIYNNNYMNDSQYIYENENNFSSPNYDNYYYNFQSYQTNNQSINLYNFNSDNYSIIRIIGKGSNGKIYLVQDLQTNQEFALKSILIDNEIELKKREEEYNLIYKIAYENPELKIINIYGLEIKKIDRYNIFLNILMEKGDYDWETEIINRKKNQNYYTEQELFYILMNLVRTFAYLQQKGISHRDVKPQNILCFGNNEYKICDFGEAKYQNDKKSKKFGNNLDNQTIRGTEMYMSPILFRAVKFKPDSLTKYNSFKSDVFSLGLCFLHASSLDNEILFKVREILDMEKIGMIINQYLGDRYSQDFINLLLYMLQVDENYRPDFIELNSWLLFENY